MKIAGSLAPRERARVIVVQHFLGDSAWRNRPAVAGAVPADAFSTPMTNGLPSTGGKLGAPSAGASALRRLLRPPKQPMVLLQDNQPRLPQNLLPRHHQPNCGHVRTAATCVLRKCRRAQLAAENRGVGAMALQQRLRRWLSPASPRIPPRPLDRRRPRQVCRRRLSRSPKANLWPDQVRERPLCIRSTSAGVRRALWIHVRQAAWRSHHSSSAW